MVRRRKLNWFQQWNYSAILWIIIYWFAKHSTFFKKLAFYGSAILIAFIIQPIITEEVSSIPVVIANYTDEIKIRIEQKKIQEAEAIRREKEYLESVRLAEAKKKLDKERYEQELLDAQYREMHEFINKGDRVLITWWGEPGIGPTPPERNFNVGQITDISGFMISGTWGDYVIDWRSSPHFEILSAREYKKLLKEAEEKYVRKLAKEARKKSHKSWGIYPGTVYTDKDGIERISVIENGTLVQKVYKRDK